MRKFIRQAPVARSFWLRCWSVGGQAAGTGQTWRFSLEDPESGHKRGFSSLQELTEFLNRELVKAASGIEVEQDAGSI